MRLVSSFLHQNLYKILSVWTSDILSQYHQCGYLSLSFHLWVSLHNFLIKSLFSYTSIFILACSPPIAFCSCSHSSCSILNLSDTSTIPLCFFSSYFNIKLWILLNLQVGFAILEFIEYFPWHALDFLYFFAS